MSSRENVKQTNETKPINTDPKSSMIPNSDVGIGEAIIHIFKALRDEKIRNKYRRYGELASLTLGVSTSCLRNFGMIESI